MKLKQNLRRTESINYANLCGCGTAGCIVDQSIMLSSGQVEVIVTAETPNLTVGKLYTTHAIMDKGPGLSVVGDDGCIAVINLGKNAEIQPETVEQYRKDIVQIKQEGLFSLIAKAVDLFDKNRSPAFGTGDVVVLREGCRFDRTIKYGDLIYVTEFIDLDRNTDDEEVVDFRGIRIDSDGEYQSIVGCSNRFTLAPPEFQIAKSK